MFRYFDDAPLFAHPVVAFFGEHLPHELFRHVYNDALGARLDVAEAESRNVGLIGDSPDHVGGMEAVDLAGLRYKPDQAGFIGLVGFELPIRQPDIRISTTRFPAVSALLPVGKLISNDKTGQ